MLVGESGQFAVSAREFLPVVVYRDRGVEAVRDSMDVLRRIHNIFEGCADSPDPALCAAKPRRSAVERHIDVPAIEDLGNRTSGQIQTSASDLHAPAAAQSVRFPAQNKQSGHKLAVVSWVSDAALGEDPGWVGRIVAELAAEVAHEDAREIGVDAVAPLLP